MKANPLRSRPSRRRFRLSLFFSLALPALLAAGRAAFAQGIPADAIVARVNGEAVMLSQLRESAIEQQKVPSADFGADVMSENYRRALTQYVDETLLTQKAQREEMQSDEAEISGTVDGLFQEMRRQMGGREGMDAWLARNGMTMETLRRLLTERERRRTLAVKIVARGVNVDAHSQEDFVQRQVKSGGPLEQVNLAQILVHCPAGEQKTETGQQRYMQALLAARQAGRDPGRFQDLVAGFSDDSAGRTRGGSLGWLDPQQLRPELRDRIRRMKTGDVSPPIATSEGFHVLMLMGRRTTRDLAFADLFEQQRAKLLKQLRAEAQIHLYDFQGNPVTLPPDQAADGGDGQTATLPEPSSTPPPALPALPQRLD